MISIQSEVEKIIKKDAEAYVAMKRGIMNFSQYAHTIHGLVESTCKKEVRHASIVIALLRMAKNKNTGRIRSYAPKVNIRNITTKLPLTEIVHDKTPSTLSSLETVFSKVKASAEDFLVMTFATQEITIICSDILVSKVEKSFKEKPKMKQSSLAAIGLSFDEENYRIPNITFSLIRKIALQQINIAETISSYTEVVFVVHQKDLNAVLEIFTKKE